jgi:hypothetical protein
MPAEIEAKTRLEAAEHVAMQCVAEAELRSSANLLRHALREYLRQRLDLIPRDVRAALGTGWDK